MTSRKDDRDESDATATDAEELIERLEPFEPYTTDELVDELDADRGLIKKLLDKLNRDGKVKKKKPKSSPTIWVREPPVNSCSDCDRQFEVKFLHPVLSSTRYCPRCGNRL